MVMKTGTDRAPASEVGLLATAQMKSELREALGGAVSEAQLDAAVARLQAAELRKWDQLPPGIDPDMGYKFRFLSCSETCWLGREVLLEGSTFRVFKLKTPAA
jgi:hypothetical protein